MKTYKGIDIALYQGNPDFAAVKAAGVDFVMHKAGQGRTPDYDAPFTDPCFEANVAACARLAGSTGGGFYSGSYWYLTARSEAEVRIEASYYISLLKKYRYNLQLWAAVDVEDAILTSDKAELTKQVALFCDLIRRAGFRPMVYASSWWIGNRFDPPAGVPIWEANWSAASRPDRARMWQYSSKGAVSGISGEVDMNVAYDIMGDANGDGKVDLKDVSAVLRRCAGWNVSINETQADMNQDGFVTLKDAAAIIKAVSGK